MTTKQYLQSVEEIKNYVLELDCDYQRDDLEVVQVWYCKTIQNHKGLFIVKNNITNSKNIVINSNKFKELHKEEKVINNNDIKQVKGKSSVNLFSKVFENKK